METKKTLAAVLAALKEEGYKRPLKPDLEMLIKARRLAHAGAAAAYDEVKKTKFYKHEAYCRTLEVLEKVDPISYKVQINGEEEAYYRNYKEARQQYEALTAGWKKCSLWSIDSDGETLLIINKGR